MPETKVYLDVPEEYEQKLATENRNLEFLLQENGHTTGKGEVLINGEANTRSLLTYALVAGAGAWAMEKVGEKIFDRIADPLLDKLLDPVLEWLRIKKKKEEKIVIEVYYIVGEDEKKKVVKDNVHSGTAAPEELYIKIRKA